MDSWLQPAVILWAGFCETKAPRAENVDAFFTHNGPWCTTRTCWCCSWGHWSRYSQRENSVSLTPRERLPCTLQWWKWIYFGLTTVPRPNPWRTFQQPQDHEHCMFYTPSAYSFLPGGCAIWCIIILISVMLPELAPPWLNALEISGTCPLHTLPAWTKLCWSETPLMLACAVFQHWKCNSNVFSKPEYQHYLIDVNEISPRVWCEQCK